MKTQITKIPADKSIANVVCVVVVDRIGTNGGHFSTRIFSLDGSEKEKLNQYKEIFGVEWKGTPASVCSTIVHEESTSLELGKQKVSKSKITLETERQLKKLCALAKKYLKENEELKERRATEKTIEAPLIE